MRCIAPRAKLEWAPMPALCYMDAEITPARSLSKRGLWIVMGITIALAAVPVGVFTFMGSPFVLPFVGIDVFGLWFAFWIMNRRVSRERVRVTADEVEVIRNHKPVWVAAPAFTRVEPGEKQIGLSSSGRRISVARDLSPDERRAFAGALDEAIRKARRERYPAA